MKNLALIFIILLMSTGCASKQIIFDRGLSQSDFSVDDQFCGGDKLGGGSFAVGPILFVGAVVAIQEVAKHIQAVKYQSCMEERGWTCVENCPVSN